MPLMCRSIAMLLAAGTVALPASAQAPVKTDLFYLFERVPPLPSNPQEAHAAADTRFDAILKDIERERGRITAAGPTGTDDMLALAKRMESMSDADRMKVAMQMAQPAGVRSLREPSNIMEAMDAYGELSSRVGGDQQSDAEYGVFWDERLNALQRAFIAMDEKARAAACARYKAVCAGGSTQFSDAELKAHDKVLMDNWDAEASMFAKLVATGRADQAKRTALLKSRLAPFNEALRRAAWGDGARDPAVVQALGQGQLLIVGAAHELVLFSSAHWRVGKELWKARLALEGKSTP